MTLFPPILLRRFTLSSSLLSLAFLFFFLILLSCLLLPSKSFSYKYVSKQTTIQNIFQLPLQTLKLSSIIHKKDHRHDKYNFALYDIMERMYTRGPPNADKSDLVLDDIDQILEAIYLHKKIYGDLDILVKFEVPDNDQWPPHLRGLRLGKRLEKILSSQEFFDKHPNYVEKIRQLGFEPSVDSLIDDWNVIYEALKCFREVYGNLRVPAKFVVPDEDPWPRLTRKTKLGVRVAAIRSAGRYIKDRRERKADLDSLGFEWRLRDHTHKQQIGDDLFDQVYSALVHYKKTINSEFNIPATFRVPEGDGWPEETWGLRLGSIVQSIREKDKLVFGHPDRENKLIELGFSLEDKNKELKSQKRFDNIYNGLVIYKELYGDLAVPQPFVIPSKAPWPEEIWGLKLGAKVNSIRAQGSMISNYPERREVLEKLGFIWDLNIVKRKKKAEEELSLSNTIDEVDDYDLDISGIEDLDELESTKSSFNLDKKKEKKLKQDSFFSDYYAEMESTEVDGNVNKRPGNRISSFPSRYTMDSNIPLTFDPSRMFEPLSYRELSAEAMREYMQSREYSEDPDIRQTAHFEGYLSPEMFHRINIRDISEEDVLAMKRVGYRILEFGKFNWEIVIEALRVYQRNFGDIDVSESYVIDDDVIRAGIGFDERFEDLDLGDAVRAIRRGDVDGLEDPERRKVLDEMNFDWGDKSKYLRFRFYPMMLGLKVYRHLYGFPMPLSNFVIPEEEQWPIWMCGMPLGEWAAVCRIQQNLLFEHYPERRNILNALEFAWWIPPGPLPKKYSEALQ